MSCASPEAVVSLGVKKPEIYAICVEGVERYIGKTVQPREKRLWQHINAAKNGARTHVACVLRAALRDGKRVTIDWVDEVQISEEWGALEAAYIQAYREDGFDLANTALGGEGLGAGADHPFFGKDRSQAHCAAISRSLKGDKHPAFGKKQSPAHIEKRAAKLRGASNPNFGKLLSSQQRQRISETLKGVFAGEKNPMFGKTHASGTLEKMSSFQKVNQRWAGVRKNNTTGFKGVSRHGRRFSAKILTTRLGSFDTAAEAAHAYDAAARGLWGEDCYLNFR